MRKKKRKPPPNASLNANLMRLGSQELSLYASVRTATRVMVNPEEADPDDLRELGCMMAQQAFQMARILEKYHAECDGKPLPDWRDESDRQSIVVGLVYEKRQRQAHEAARIFGKKKWEIVGAIFEAKLKQDEVVSNEKEDGVGD